MNYNYLGKTNIKVSEFALGCWPFAGGSVWGTQDKSDSISPYVAKPSYFAVIMPFWFIMNVNGSVKIPHSITVGEIFLLAK